MSSEDPVISSRATAMLIQAVYKRLYCPNCGNLETDDEDSGDEMRESPNQPTTTSQHLKLGAIPKQRPFVVNTTIQNPTIKQNRQMSQEKQAKILEHLSKAQEVLGKIKEEVPSMFPGHQDDIFEQLAKAQEDLQKKSLEASNEENTIVPVFVVTKHFDADSPKLSPMNEMDKGTESNFRTMYKRGLSVPAVPISQYVPASRTTIRRRNTLWGLYMRMGQKQDD